MSASFRPVKAIWGEHSSQFVEREVLIGLLADVAARADSTWREQEVSDVTEVFIPEGQKFLDYVGKDERFNAESMVESLIENGFEVEKGDLDSLISNMRGLAHQWKASLEGDGSLRFYVD